MGVARYANERGVQIIGDIPIFVAHDSADVWANRGLYHLDEFDQPTLVAGVPPDYFSADGQLWGNPLYRWDLMAKDGYSWWISRIRSALTMVDLVRLDHFRGFEKYWSVPAGETTARRGVWEPGPGADFLAAIAAALGELPIIAEDLGLITDEVRALRDQFNLPGMHILQFAFSSDPGADHLKPYRFKPNSVVYTGTHDNDTTVGWFSGGAAGATTRTQTALDDERSFLLRYLGTDGQEINWDLIRLALASVADLAIIPLQDLLGLGAEARMNTPSRESGNWSWRYQAAQLTPEIGQRLGEMTMTYGRHLSRHVPVRST
jgi:4-alpha-glucanotransferase